MLVKFQMSNVLKICISRFHVRQKEANPPNRFKIQRKAKTLVFLTYLCILLMDLSLHSSSHFLAHLKAFSYPYARQ